MPGFFPFAPQEVLPSLWLYWSNDVPLKKTHPTPGTAWTRHPNACQEPPPRANHRTPHRKTTGQGNHCDPISLKSVVLALVLAREAGSDEAAAWSAQAKAARWQDRYVEAAELAL